MGVVKGFWLILSDVFAFADGNPVWPMFEIILNASIYKLDGALTQVQESWVVIISETHLVIQGLPRIFVQLAGESTEWENASKHEEKSNTQRPYIGSVVGSDLIRHVIIMIIEKYLWSSC